MSKIRNKNTRVSNPYEGEEHNTEWTGAAILMEWINKVAKEEGINVGDARVEKIKKQSRKRADISIAERPQSQNNLCIIECKMPQWDVYAPELIDDARNKANEREAPYFATCNFRKLVWWNTEKANDPKKPESEKVVNEYELAPIYDLQKIEQDTYRNKIQRALADFVNELYEVFSGKKNEPKPNLDDFLIQRLHEKIKVLAYHYSNEIIHKVEEDEQFKIDLQKWFAEQNWDFHFQEEDYDKAARQTAYLLVNKILFYNVLQIQKKQLDPLEVPKSLTKGSRLQKILQGYFDDVLEIDYETVYTTDFIDQIAFPENREIVEEIKNLITFLGEYNFSKISYDIVGRIFERLIPADERHYLGQYFTNANVVDLILSFCLEHEDDKVVDPSCGTGTFLVRAYQYKKLLNHRLDHETLLQSIWGNDIAKFPAHLATINLAIRDLSVDQNYPNIIREDYFNIQVGNDGFELPSRYRKRMAMALGTKQKEITYPRWFDAIVGNPPYTRQEEIPEIGVDKSEVIKNALHYGNKPLAKIGKRAGIYSYFFTHGWKMLREGGKFGFIVSNSWMDADYGKGLQKFFLENFKILAVIESKVERWFVDADINTAIIILEKCNDKKEREDNYVRFGYLKKTLDEFIPPTSDKWEDQVYRKERIDDLRRTILSHTEHYENEDLRVFPKKQIELWEEAYDKKKEEFIGSKWGKYLRGPKIFYTLLAKAKDELIPLKELANVRFGIKTGANEFFYLKESDIKAKGIEREFWMHPSLKEDFDYNTNFKKYENVYSDKNGKLFQNSQYSEIYNLKDVLQPDNCVYWVPNYVIKSPKECKTLTVDPTRLELRVLMIHQDKKKLKNKNILKHVKVGEQQGIQNRPTLSGQNRWYDLGERDRHCFLHPMIHYERQLISINDPNVYVDHNLFEVRAKSNQENILLALFFISTPSIIFKEMGGRVNLGEGALKTEGTDILRLFNLDFSKIQAQVKEKLNQWFIQHQSYSFDSIFEEIGADKSEDFQLSYVKEARRSLDKIFLEDIFNLTEGEQVDIYKAVIDLISNRKEKAKSVKKEKKTKEGFDVEGFVSTVLDKIEEPTLGQIYQDQILSKKPRKTIELPKKKGQPKVEEELMGFVVKNGKQVLECESKEEAKLIQMLWDAGLEEIQIPAKQTLKKVVPELERRKMAIEKTINDYLPSIINQKDRKKVEDKIWRKVIEVT